MMELNNSARNIVLRLPPGFRFHPTDEELAGYLKLKMLAYPLSASIISELDVIKFDPWDLPGDSEQERYFFSPREAKYQKGMRFNRATDSGYWKATGLDKKIVSSKSHQVVGMKKTLVFYRGKPPKGCRTDWIMHEYRLVTEQTTLNSAQESWVICRIFLKKRKNQSGDEDAGLIGSGTVYYDFMGKGGTDLNLLPTQSCSGSSGVTEISDQNKPDDQEDSSSCNSFTNTFT